MSLFKVRDFWTFDLEALKLQTGDTSNALSDIEDDCQEGSITASVGRFNSIGQQDVFVCGDLRGVLYIIQVPIADQRKYIKERSATDGQSETSELTTSAATATATDSRLSPTGSSSSSSNTQAIDDRQLLAATSLGMPVVDIECGYFTSALKQTIAVLSFDKLLLLQVKRRKVADLMNSESPPTLTFVAGQLAEGGKQQSLSQHLTINENLLSHEFEESVRIDLLPGQFAYKLVVLNSHSESSLSEQVSTQKDGIKEAADLDGSMGSASKRVEGGKFLKRSKIIVQQLHLPQRDKLIVQYVNQFLFTLVDGKKVAGHFAVCSADDDRAAAAAASRESADSNHDVKLQQMSQCVGSMPAAYLHSHRASSSLVLSFSDHRIHSIPLDKLLAQAKQDVMKRVALNLLQNKGSSSTRTGAGGVGDKPLASSLAYTSGLENMAHGHLPSGLINLDVESTATWSKELLAMPLQMLGLQRKARDVGLVASAPPPPGHRDELTVGQLLIMSRYSFDLFTACGQHLWSQRFETPLIHSFAYTLEPPDARASEGSDQSLVVTVNEGKQRVEFSDHLISLVCADSLTVGKSNLMILKEDQCQWSALLNAKPLKVWRLNLTYMPGLLAMLDIKQNQLVVSYLGTNATCNDDDRKRLDSDDELDDADGEEATDICKLELLSEPMAFRNELKADEGGNTTDQTREAQRSRLVFEVSLDAAGKLPDVCVNINIQLQMDSNSTGVLHDIVATLEYDDLLGFDLSPGDEQSITMISFPSRGVARVQLGNCWPDRREPIRLRGQFNLLTRVKSAHGAAALNELNILTPAPQVESNSKLIPKSLKVSVLLSYKETHSSLLVQEESFLLPISMIAQLTHVDYTNGSGQNLDDVLTNLGQYKQFSDGKASSAKQCCCDLFLKLDCQLIGLLEEFVERDLVCRGSMAVGLKRGTQVSESEKQIETLENINLLAQSLDCRLRYKNPLGRQSSEELIVPVMASFALRFDCIYSSTLLHPPENSDKYDDTVWLHMCTLDSTESSIPEELIKRHMKDWVRYPTHETEQQQQQQQPDSGVGSAETSSLLVSIECNRPLPLVLMLDHVLERVRRLTSSDTRLATALIRANHFESYDKFRETVETGRHYLAVSSSLHDSLKSIANLYETQHRERVSHINDKLAQEHCKFHIATAAILSLCKQLPSLPDDVSELLGDMNAVVKHCQKSIMDTLNELISLKTIDYQLSKLPNVPLIKLKQASSKGGDELIWPINGLVID